MDTLFFYKVLFTQKRFSSFSVVKQIRNIAKRMLLEVRPSLDGIELQEQTELLIEKAHKDLSVKGYRFTPFGLVTRCPEVKITTDTTSIAGGASVNAEEFFSPLLEKTSKPIWRSSTPTEANRLVKRNSLRRTAIPAPVESPRLATPRRSKRDASSPQKLEVQRAQTLSVNRKKIVRQNEQQTPKSTKSMFSRNQSVRSSVKLNGEKVGRKRNCYACLNLHN